MSATPPSGEAPRPAEAGPPTDVSPALPARCGIDSVEIARIERLLAETPAGELAKIFSPQELEDAGDGPGRAAGLAARYAAKEACVKLFPRELAMASIEPADFSVTRDAYGARRSRRAPRRVRCSTAIASRASPCR